MNDGIPKIGKKKCKVTQTVNKSSLKDQVKHIYLNKKEWLLCHSENKVLPSQIETSGEEGHLKWMAAAERTLNSICVNGSQNPSDWV